MLTVRPAVATDQEALGRLGGTLVRQHHAADPARFIHVGDPETGYGRFLVSRIGDPESLVIVAERDGGAVGYLYAGVEPMSWMDLRGPCAIVHDVVVDEGARRLGAGRALLGAALDWVRSKGMHQVVLMTMTGNEPAQQLFRSLGFRSTMLEMTLDL